MVHSSSRFQLNFSDKETCSVSSYSYFNFDNINNNHFNACCFFRSGLSNHIDQSNIQNFHYKIKLSKFTQHSPFSTILNTSLECATIRILPKNLTINLEENQPDIVALLLV